MGHLAIFCSSKWEEELGNQDSKDRDAVNAQVALWALSPPVTS